MCMYYCVVITMQLALLAYNDYYYYADVRKGYTKLGATRDSDVIFLTISHHCIPIGRSDYTSSMLGVVVNKHCFRAGYRWTVDFRGGVECNLCIYAETINFESMSAILNMPEIFAVNLLGCRHSLGSFGCI